MAFIILHFAAQGFPEVLLYVLDDTTRARLLLRFKWLQKGSVEIA